MLKWLISFAILCLCVFAGDTIEPILSPSPEVATCDVQAAQIASLTSVHQKLASQLERLEGVQKDLIKKMEELSKTTQSSASKLEVETKKCSSAIEESAIQTATLKKNVDSIPNTLKTVQQNIDKLLSQLRSDIEQQASTKLELTRQLDQLRQRLQALENSSILSSLQELAKIGIASGTKLFSFFGVSSLKALADPSFYSALYNMFSERVAFLKYASVNRVLPSFLYDFSQIKTFTTAKLNLIYSHELVRYVKRQASPYLTQMNVEKEYHDSIVNALVLLFLVCLFLFSFSILAAILSCLCPTASTIPQPFPTVQPPTQPSTQPAGQPPTQPSTQPSVQPPIQPSTQPSTQPSDDAPASNTRPANNNQKKKKKKKN